MTRWGDDPEAVTFATELASVVISTMGRVEDFGALCLVLTTWLRRKPVMVMDFLAYTSAEEIKRQTTRRLDELAGGAE